MGGQIQLICTLSLVKQETVTPVSIRPNLKLLLTFAGNINYINLG